MSSHVQLGYPRFDGSQACARPTDVEAAGFAGERGADPGPAQIRCSDEVTGKSCPFLVTCRSYGLTHDVVGVWGGLTAEERRDVRAEVGLSEPRPITEELDALVASWRATSQRRAWPRGRRAA